MRPALATALVVLLLATTLACADKAPAGFKHDAPPVITNMSYFAMHASPVNKKGEPISGRSVAFSGGPADVLEVSASGNLRCAKSGDATVILTAGSFTENVPLKCRVPTEIEMPAELEVVMGAPPAALHVPALGEGGKPLDGVTIEYTSADPAILAVEGDKVKGVAVGKTRLQGSAGGITGVSRVEVVETIVSDPLTLRDGAVRTITLQPGTYRVVVDLKADPRLKQGVTVTWAGTACDNQPESESQRQICRVAETATVTIANPKLMGVGATVNGTLKVHRVPD